ncbi:uncharacterized protein TNCV_4485251 [Trichonephila clavipes]|nr:uncharacterized protein TNCV_4485251 [Trichonephila clavipes]
MVQRCFFWPVKMIPDSGVVPRGVSLRVLGARIIDTAAATSLVWTSSELTYGMFSEEYRFILQSDSRRTFIWKTPDTRYHQDNIIEWYRYGGAELLCSGRDYTGFQNRTVCSNRNLDISNVSRHHSEITSTRGLLVKGHEILNRSQVTWMTPELAPPSPNYHTTPRDDVSALDRFNVHRCPARWVYSGTGLELMTCLP